MRRRLTSFLRLPARERLLLVEAGLVVLFARCALTLLPFRTVLSIWRRWGRPQVREASPCRWPAETIVRAVERTSRYVPAATCLTRSLAAQVLLARTGHACSVEIGVARDAREGLRAHAWIESGGVIILESDEGPRYTRLLSLRCEE